MGRDERPGSGDKKELGKTKHGGGVRKEAEVVGGRNPMVVDTSRQPNT